MNKQSNTSQLSRRGFLALAIATPVIAPMVTTSITEAKLKAEIYSYIKLYVECEQEEKVAIQADALRLAENLKSDKARGWWLNLHKRMVEQYG